MFQGDASALQSLLYGFVVRPLLQAVGLQIGKCCLILLGQSGCKVPGNHHVDIVFLSVQGCNPG